MSSSRRRWTASTRWSTSPAPASATTGGPRRTSSRSSPRGSTARTTVASALAELAGRGQRPVLVSGSAIGIYGPDRGEEVLTEDSPTGHGFLCDVVRAWEAASKPAEDAGLRVVHARTGLVLSPRGGAMARVLPLARLGLAGPLGSGRQYWSWITLQDEVRALAWAIDQPSLSGTVNLTGPQPLPQIEVIKAVASALGRPALLPAPSLALKIYLGEFSSDILGSLRVTPSVLTASGFTFEQESVDAAAQWLVGQA